MNSDLNSANAPTPSWWPSNGEASLQTDVCPEDLADTTPIPNVEREVAHHGDPETLEIFTQPDPVGNPADWFRRMAACFVIGSLVATGYFFISKEKPKIGKPVLADTEKTSSEPLKPVVIESIQSAGFTLPVDNVPPHPFALASDEKPPIQEKQKSESTNQTGKNAPEFEVQYFMGEAYCFGRGVEQDLKKGIAMLEDASRDGSEKAANLLATCYSMGHGVEQNYNRAHELLNTAIERGSPFAYGNLGVLHLRGFGCERDPKRAQEFFLKGADKGDPVAAFFAAKCFEDGIGLNNSEPDKDRAVFWYLQAAKWGHDDAISWCRENKLMTKEEKTIRF